MNEKMTLLQQEQIDLGIANGLSRQQVKRYAKKKYNFLQMQELRQALENCDDPKDIRCMFDYRLSHQEMEEMRLRIQNGQNESVDKKRILFSRPECIPLYTIGMVSVVSIVLFLGVSWVRVNEHDVLSLKDNVIDLKKGDVFEPLKYVETCSSADGKLVLPSLVDTGHEGNYAAVYHLNTQNGNLTQILTVRVHQDE